MSSLAENFKELAVLEGLSVKKIAQKMLGNERYQHFVKEGLIPPSTKNQDRDE
jgi:hypothetical protein|tara:strand:+ start:13687 stop:13845 length:159 start_codon:yes stop_codon:yes gene_type:complete